jgi:hypothetical protein
MLNDIQVGFLRDRIQEIGSALFSNTGNTAFKLPTSIINVLRVDAAGNIWFFLHSPEWFMDETDKEFPAKLDFYRKGKPFYLQVSGQALIITEEQQINELTATIPELTTHSFNDVMLIKVRVEHASCFEHRERTVSRLQSWWHAICKYLLQQKPSYRPYKMRPIVLA